MNATDHEIIPSRIFQEASAKYEAALREKLSLLPLIVAKQAMWQSAKENLELREAELSLDPDVQSGNNAETRKANLRIAQEKDKSWRSYKDGADEMALDLQKFKDQLSVQQDAMALAKRQIDFATAWLQLVGREGGENHDHA